MDTKLLKQKILDLAIRGKLVPQDTNDEPASVLLERIHAEKERLIREGKIKRSKGAYSETPNYENVPFEIPQGWSICTLDDITLFIRNGLTIKQNKSADGFPITRIETISKGVVDLDKMGYANLTDEERYNPYFLQHRDILFSHINSPIYVGKVALCDSIGNSKIVHGMNLLCIRPSYLVDSKFILYAIRSPLFRMNMRPLIQDAVNQASISINSVKNISFPLPPFEEQKRIASALQLWFSVVDKLEQSKFDLQEAIKQTKSKILDLAIHGKLVPQDPTDEPASVLLKRINPDFTPCNDSQYEDLPKGWAVAKVDEIAELLSGRDLPKDVCNDESHGIPYLIGASNIVDNCFSFTRWTKYPQVISTKGDVLISCKGTIGEVLKNNIGEIHIARQFMALRPHPDCVLSDYLQIYLWAIIEKIKKDARGVIPGISRDDILEKYLCIPPINEQNRIVQKIQEINDNLQAILAEL